MNDESINLMTHEQMIEFITECGLQVMRGFIVAEMAKKLEADIAQIAMDGYTAKVMGK